MLGRLAIIFAGVAGLVVTGLAVASATIWKPDDVLRATYSGDSVYLATAPGVLELAGSPTTITVTTAGDEPVTVAVGRSSDVIGWLGSDEYDLVTGFSSWHKLDGDVVVPAPVETQSAETAPAEETPAEEAPAEEAPAEEAPAEEAPAEEASAEDAPAEDTPAEEASAEETAPQIVDPAGSDMWVASAQGEGEAALTWSSDYPGRWSVLAASSSGAPVTIELSWPREVSTPWLVPGLVVGLGLFAAAVLMLLRKKSGRSVVPAVPASMSEGVERLRDAVRRSGQTTSTTEDHESSSAPVRSREKTVLPAWAPSRPWQKTSRPTAARTETTSTDAPQHADGQEPQDAAAGRPAGVGRHGSAEKDSATPTGGQTTPLSSGEPTRRRLRGAAASSPERSAQEAAPGLQQPHLDQQRLAGTRPQGRSSQGQPLRGQPTQGQPLRGQPTQGQPLQGQPLRGQPTQGPSLQGQSPDGSWPQEQHPGSQRSGSQRPGMARPARPAASAPGPAAPYPGPAAAPVEPEPQTGSWPGWVPGRGASGSRGVPDRGAPSAGAGAAGGPAPIPGRRPTWLRTGQTDSPRPLTAQIPNVGGSPRLGGPAEAESGGLPGGYASERTRRADAWRQTWGMSDDETNDDAPAADQPAADEPTTWRQEKRPGTTRRGEQR